MQPPHVTHWLGTQRRDEVERLAVLDFPLEMPVLALSASEGSQLYAPAGQAPVAFIDARDIAAVALTALRGGHEGRTYEITGPQALTYEEVAAELAGLLGHGVEYVDLPAGAFSSALEGAGMSPVLVESLSALMATVRAGSQATVTPTVGDLLGRPATSLADFLADHRAAFLPP